ncbi:FUSC family protein [Mycolicibacterium fortuitum]|uniref:FUSC family protein n=1 Tax=Mycolicibacterium fortuitum TaxID=1766 RepID=UPI000A8B0D69|nr:FUSC family protein [Mycolicibacterium fortuitum]
MNTYFIEEVSVDALIEEVIVEASNLDEIGEQLDEIAGGDEERSRGLGQELLNSLRGRKAGMQLLVGGEHDRYREAYTHYCNLRGNRLAHTGLLEQMEHATSAMAQANGEVDESFARFERLLKRRREVLNECQPPPLSEHDRANSEQHSRQALRGSVFGVKACRVWDAAVGRLRRRRTTTPSPRPDDSTMLRTALDREIAQAQLDHGALVKVVAPRIGEARSKQRAAEREAVRFLDGDTAVQLARSELTVATQALRQAMLEKAVLPAMREWINDVLVADRPRLYRQTFDVADTSGLAQMAAAFHEVPTKAFEQLDDLLAHLGGGSVGISGPRGAGKTTLIRSRCEVAETSPPDVVGVMVAAPVEYEPREFLSHLFAKLCLEAAPQAGQVAVEGDRAQLRSRTPFVVAAAGTVVVAAGIGLLARALLDPAPWDVLLATLAVVLSILLFPAVRWSIPAPVQDIGLPDRHDGTGALRRRDRWSLRSLSALQRFNSGPLLAVLGWALSFIAARLYIEASGSAGERPWGRADSQIPAALVVMFGFAMGIAAVIVVLIVLRPRRSQLLFAGLQRHTVAGYCAGLGITLLIGAPFAALDAQPALRLAGVTALVSFGYAMAMSILVERAHGGGRYPLAVAATDVGMVLFTAASGSSVAAAWSVTLRPQTIWGAVLLGVGVSLLRLWSTHYQPGGHGEAVRVSLRVAAAAVELRKLLFLQTDSRGWSNAVKLGALAGSPLTAEHSDTGGMSLAQLPATYPDLVARFHAYVEKLTTEGVTVIIGIDELDKLSEDAADRFMNGVKAIFDGSVPGCYYLVSISEEALASFEQRGLIARNVFDTAFDAMLRVGYLDMDGTVALLRKRVIDLPRGVATLCHALSGGLPRDIIRFMRLAVRIRGDRDSISLEELSRAVCQNELADRLHGLRTASRSLDNWFDVSDLGSWARTLNLDDITSLQNVSPRLLDAPAPPDGDRALQLLRIHTCSFYQLATIHQFFATADGDRIHDAEKIGGAGAIQRLADARNEIETDPSCAWQLISEFRAHWGLVP